MYVRYPPYTPLCNSILRFYLTYPDLKEFSSQLSERQYKAAEKAYNNLSEYWQNRIRKYVKAERPQSNLLDTYIFKALEHDGLAEEEIKQFYGVLLRLDHDIALYMNYIETSEKEG